MATQDQHEVRKEKLEQLRNDHWAFPNDSKPNITAGVLHKRYAENVDEETYCDAIVKDKQKWQEAVDARLLGRAQSRAAVIESSNEAI